MIFLSYFLCRHAFSTFASSFLRGKRAKPTHKQKDMPKANARIEKNQIKISSTALFKTSGQEWEMTGQTKQDRSNDCLTAPWQYGGRSGYMNVGALNKHYSNLTVLCN